MGFGCDSVAGRRGVEMGETVIPDDGVMYLTVREWEQLEEALAAPAVVSPALRALLSRTEPWVDE